MADDVDPRTGRALEPWETLVVGAPETGPRRTVVDTRPGAFRASWIVQVDVPVTDDVYVSTYLDNGHYGGTYQPDGAAYQLPDLVTTAAADPAWHPLLVLLALLAAGTLMGARRRRRRR